MDDDAIKARIAALRAAIRKWPSVLLDDLYIRVDVAMAERRFAEQVGRPVRDLTEQERVLAVLEAYVRCVSPQTDEDRQRQQLLQDIAVAFDVPLCLLPD